MYVSYDGKWSYKYTNIYIMTGDYTTLLCGKNIGFCVAERVKAAQVTLGSCPEGYVGFTHQVTGYKYFKQKAQCVLKPWIRTYHGAWIRAGLC